ncbi:hypothetical protein Tco_0766974 [Tanacetum coccineum]
MMLFSNTKLLISAAQSHTPRGGCYRVVPELWIIMVNEIPLDYVDDVPIVEPNQHDDVPIVLEPVLVDEDKDPEEDEFEEE